MKLTLIRTSLQEGFTTGILYVEEKMICHTLEPQRRNLSAERKVHGKTAIPEGTYRIELKESPKFKRVMPYLMNVPHFSGIMIHWGNSVKDTLGCILVGDRADYDTLKCSRITIVCSCTMVLHSSESKDGSGRIHVVNAPAKFVFTTAKNGQNNPLETEKTCKIVH